MKQYLLLFSAFFALATASAQIVLDKDDLIKVNKKYDIFKVSDSSSWKLDTLKYGKPGADGVYDFRLATKLGYKKTTFNTMGLVDIGIGADKAHATADMGVLAETDSIYYRDPIKFDSDDLPKAGDKYDVVSVDPNGRFGNAINIYDFEEDQVPRYNFGGFRFLFDSTETPAEYLDPSKTQWSADFTDADAAKLVSEIEDDQGNIIGRIYDFYEEQGGDLIKTHVGAQFDKGFLSAQQANGDFANAASKVTPNHTIRSSKMATNYRGGDSSAWSVEITEGITTLKHREVLRDTFFVLGNGILYMDHDSFQVVKVLKYQWHYTESEILVMGTSVQTTDDLTLNVSHEYYAKGYGDPVLKIDFNEEMDSVTSMSYIRDRNKVPFTKESGAESLKMYSFYNVDDKKAEIVGISALIDVQGQFTRVPSGKIDTLHIPFKGTQLTTSTAFDDQFTDKSTVEWDVTLKFNETTSVKLGTKEEREIIVDGYGTIYLFDDTASVLRVRIKTTEIQTSQSIEDGVPGAIEEDTTETFIIEYWGKSAGVPLASAEFIDGTYSWPFSFEFTAIPELPTSVSDHGTLEAAVFPNPASNNFTVSLIGMSAAEVNITDIHGRTMVSERTSDQLNVDASQWSRGIYLVKMTNLTNGKTAIKKLVVE